MSVRVVSLIIVASFVVSARAEVFDISALINTAQESPAPTGTSASTAGFASVQFDDVSKELSWNIAWQDLTGPAVGMHFHAPAAPGTNSGVAVNIGDVSGLVSPSIGSTIVTDAFASDLLSGQSYVNIHTATNGPGEIRGQVNPTNINLSANLSPSQEVPAPTGVPAGASGSAQVAYDPSTNLLGWIIEWDNLSGPATGMHFHGPAGVGETASVQLGIGDVSGLTSPSIGSAVISDEFATELLNGQWYINIHTAANGPGEIRGQVVPEPTSAFMGVVAALGCLSFVRRRRNQS